MRLCDGADVTRLVAHRAEPARCPFCGERVTRNTVFGSFVFDSEAKVVEEGDAVLRILHLCPDREARAALFGSLYLTVRAAGSLIAPWDRGRQTPIETNEPPPKKEPT